MDPNALTESSYAINNYGEVFRAVVEAFNPPVCVELGVLNGYSTLAIGLAIQKYKGHLDSYDLFEDYPFRHCDFEVAKAVIKEHGLEDIVTLHKDDAFKAHENFAVNSVGLLHVDLSNTGDILHQIMELWDSRIVQGGVILLEGGSEERDKIDWMVKYSKSSIKEELEKNAIIEAKYVFGTYLAYPSLTCMLKKRL